MPEVVCAIPQALLIRSLARYSLDVASRLRRRAGICSFGRRTPSVALVWERESFLYSWVCGAVYRRAYALQISQRSIGAFDSVL
jgi:hypothetical protein